MVSKARRYGLDVIIVLLQCHESCFLPRASEFVELFSMQLCQLWQECR